MRPAAYLSIVVEANTDKATTSLRKFDRTVHGTSTTTTKALSGMQVAGSRSLAALGRAAKYTGIAIGAGLVIETKRAVEAWREAEKVGAQTNAVIKSTGGVANVSAKQVEKLANAVSLKSGIDDEAIQSGQNLLLTFKNVRNEAGEGNKVFSQATRIITDMSVAMGQDLKASTLQVGKALNDPITGLTSLTRVGVQFTEQQKDQIAAMVESGRTMQAQGVILRELNSQFAGSAKAQADPFDKARVAVENLEESFGRLFGPVLADGLTALAKFINQMQSGTGAGGKFMDVLKAIGGAIKTYVNALVNAGQAVGRWSAQAVADIKRFWKEAEVLRAVVKGMAAAIKVAFGLAVEFVKNAWEKIKGIFKLGTEAIKGAVKIIGGILKGDFGQAWDGVKDIFSAGLHAAVDVLKAITDPFRNALERLAEMIKDVFKNAFGAAVDIVKDAADAILGTVHRLTTALDKGFEAIVKFTNKALVAFGVKPLAFSVAGAVAQGAQAKQKGGVIHAARGRMVPGRGSGDKVPAMLEPGEVVLNRRAVAAMGGARRANKINRLIPRFAAGGFIDPAGPGTGVVNPAIAKVVGAWSQKYNAAINYGYDPGGGHQSPGHNITGTATDTSPAAGWGPGPTSLFEAGLRAITGKVDQILYGSHGVGTPYPNHGYGNHAHIEWGMHPDVQGAIQATIKRVLIDGPDGPLKSLGQAALDKVRSAAQKYLGRKGGMSAGADLMAQGAYKGPLDKIFPHWTTLANPGVALRPNDVASLASKAGLPGSTFEKIAHGESGYHPGIRGDDPGGTHGYGLWQITSGYNDDIIRKVGLDNLANPWMNAQAAKMIYDRQGIDAWYGTQYLQSGGIVGQAAQHFGKGGHVKPSYMPTVYSPSAMGHGGQSYTPAPPSIALQFAQLDVAMANAATTLGVADDRAVLDQRALLVKSQIAKVTKALSRKGLSAAKRLKLTQQLASLKGDLNSIASDQQALYPSDFTPGGDQTVYDTAAADEAAANAAALQANTDALNAIKEELAMQNALVGSALASDYTQALAYIGDLLSGAIGGQVAPRLSTAGSGSVIRS